MVFESAIVNTVILALITGGVISGLAVLASEKVKLDWKKFIYSLTVATIAGLVVIETFEEGVTEDNVIQVFLAIIGGSFIGSKIIGVTSKLKGLVKPPQ